MDKTSDPGRHYQCVPLPPIRLTLTNDWVTAPRVNHCAVRATVVGGSGHEIYVYGGQELGQSKRDSAIWILSIPS